MADVLMVVPIGDTGDEMAITVEWTPDPRIIESKMLEAANAFEDWSMPLAEARQLMIESTEAHFDSESDPYGNKWVPLDGDYKVSKIKAEYPEDILVRTGAMKDAATSEENWIITGNSVFFNTSALPSYAPVHQEGTSNQSPEVFWSQRGGEALNIETASRLAKESKEGSGNNTPRRMFLGADEFTVLEIEQIFIEHMDRTVIDYIDWVAPVPGDIVTTSRGFSGTLTSVPAFGGGFLVRGAHGRFVPGVHRL